jgi:hypothetical protein
VSGALLRIGAFTNEERVGRRDTEPTVDGVGFVELGPEEVDDEPMGDVEADTYEGRARQERFPGRGSVGRMERERSQTGRSALP